MHIMKNKRRCRGCGEIILFGNSPYCEDCDVTLFSAKQRRQYQYMIKKSCRETMSHERLHPHLHNPWE